MTDKAPLLCFASETPPGGDGAPTETALTSDRAPSVGSRGVSTEGAGTGMPAGGTAHVAETHDANCGTPAPGAGFLGVVGTGQAALAALKAKCGLKPFTVAAALLQEAESRGWAGFATLVIEQ